MACIAVPALSLRADITNFFDEPTEIGIKDEKEKTSPGVLFVKGEKDGEMAPWLGVATEALPKVLSAQLGLDGGIAVTTVVPDSPAAKAGIMEHDVLVKMDGVVLDSPQTFRELVRGQTSGDKVKIELVRKGERVEVEAELTEKEIVSQSVDEPDPNSKPKRSRSLFGRDPFDDPFFEGMGFGSFGGLGSFREIEEQMARMQAEMESRFNNLGKMGGGSGFMKMENSVMSYHDEDGSVKITRNDGKTHVEMRDPDGKVLFDGPADTEEERKKLPEKVVKKLESLEKSQVDLNDFGLFKIEPPRMGTMPGELDPEVKPNPRRKSEVEKEAEKQSSQAEAGE